jgi:hypothetical protein
LINRLIACDEQRTPSSLARARWPLLACATKREGSRQSDLTPCRRCGDMCAREASVAGGPAAR